MERDNRLDSWKRRIFLIALPIASLAALVDRLIHPGHGLLARPVGLVGIVAPLMLALLLWRRRRSLRFVESGSLGLVLGLLISLFAGLLVADGPSAAEQLASFSPWFSIALVAVFLVFEPRRAAWIAAGFYLVALGFAAAYLVSHRLAGATPVLIRPLLHLFLANAAFIIFLFFYARVREQYDRTRSLARSMSNLAHTDPLLGIANRRGMYAQIRDEILAAEAGATPPMLVVFDLDRFKEVNDTYGHETGDKVLQQTAAAIEQVLRASDRFGRWGGDEFVVLIAVADPGQAHLAAQRLREAVHLRMSEHLWRVTISLGVAAYRPGDSVESWVKRADQALYRAKQTGRDRVVVGT